MRKPVRPFFVLMLSVLVSCNLATRKDALHLHNTIVAINDSLYLRGREYGDLVGSSFKSKDFSKLNTSRIDFERFIDSSRQSMLVMKDVGGSGALRRCEIELLDVEKNMIDDDFIPFEQLKPSSSDSEIAMLFEAIKKDSKNEQDQMIRLRKQQEDFARRNGFKLRPVAGK